MLKARSSVDDTWLNLTVLATHSEQTASSLPLQKKTWNECLGLMLCFIVILELNWCFNIISGLLQGQSCSISVFFLPKIQFNFLLEVTG